MAGRTSAPARNPCDSSAMSLVNSPLSPVLLSRLVCVPLTATPGAQELSTAVRCGGLARRVLGLLTLACATHLAVERSRIMAATDQDGNPQKLSQFEFRKNIFSSYVYKKIVHFVQ